MRRTLTVAALTLVIAVLGYLVGIVWAASNCRDCQPSSNTVSASGLYRIGFEPGGFTSTERSNIVQGSSSYWNSVFNQHSLNIGIAAQEQAYASAEIKIFVDESLEGPQ